MDSWWICLDNLRKKEVVNFMVGYYLDSWKFPANKLCLMKKSISNKAQKRWCGQFDFWNWQSLVERILFG